MNDTINHMFPKKITGKYVTLESYSHDLRESLLAAMQNEELWQYIRDPEHTFEQFKDIYLNDLEKSHSNKDHVAYVVRDKYSNDILGATRFYDISPSNKRVCIGFTWYSKSVWGKGINPDVKLLLLSHIFDSLSWNRVEFLVDSRNTRSISAITYLGAIQEGLLRRHKIVQGNYVRDTIVFSITTLEWPYVKTQLLKRLNN